jgi:hypothetical protein
MTRHAGLALVALVTLAGCGTSTIRVRPQVSPGTYDEDPAAESSAPPRAAAGPVLPRCVEDPGLPPPAFPKQTDGADYRAIVQVTIGDKGEAVDPCIRRSEGPSDLEEKALKDRHEWKWDPKFAGQKRDHIVSFRLGPR